MRTSRPLLLSALLLGLATGAAPAGKAPRLRTPDHLPGIARELLVERMRDHGGSMAALTWAVVLLERQAVAALADEIERAPRLARGDPSSADLNSLLPARFFELQDELRARAGELGKAARQGSDRDLARAYGRLSETCVACHSVYLDPGQTWP